MFRTIVQVQAKTKAFETVTNIVKHERTCSFCQKPECLLLVNNSAIAKLRGIKLFQ